MGNGELAKKAMVVFSGGQEGERIQNLRSYVHVAQRKMKQSKNMSLNSTDFRYLNEKDVVSVTR